MLRLTQGRLLRAGVDHGVELKHADVLQLPRTGQYDAVVAQFFLNVFAPRRLAHILSSLAGHLNPDGRLIIGDFAPAPGGGHLLQQAYHDLPMTVFARLGANAKHAIHDLPAHLATAGFAVSERRQFPLFGIGPGWIEGLVAAPARI
jgi:SAM-dependent methyltransferase